MVWHREHEDVKEEEKRGEEGGGMYLVMSVVECGVSSDTCQVPRICLSSCQLSGTAVVHARTVPAP